MTTNPQDKATCPECGREIGLHNNGRLRVHNDESSPPPFRCPGSRWEPQALVAEMLAHDCTPKGYIHA